MPGLYTHTTRAAGTVVTATIYNGDHQNHIDNQTPDKTDDWSPDVTTKRSVDDPFATQTTDTLAASLADELEQIRYMVREVMRYINGNSSMPSSGGVGSATDLGTAVAQWYHGLSNPAFRAVGCHAYKVASFTHTTSGAWESVTFDTERWDQDGESVGFHEGVTNPTRITVPAGLAGKYLIWANATFPSSATGDRRSARIRLNGATVICGGETSNSHVAVQQPAVNPTCCRSLSAGDYVELQINQDIGATQAITGPDGTGGPEMGISLIGA